MFNWQNEAGGLVKKELAHLNLTYGKLVLRLAAIGVHETERSIASKLSRGTFPFTFYLQCMKALGYKKAEIDLERIDVDGPKRGPAHRR
jgi:hypothetical protein